jgi:hypothetical protein
VKKLLSIVKLAVIVVGLQFALSSGHRADADELCGEGSEVVGFEDVCVKWEDRVDPETNAILPICVEWDSEPICYNPPLCEIGDPDPCGRCGGDADYGKSCSGSGS